MKNNQLVLIADDEPMLRKALSKIVKRMGHSVIAVEDGQAAIEVFSMQHKEINLVVLDMNMPRKNGAEAFQVIFETDSSVPVVISSGDGLEQVRARLTQTPAAVISKPYNLMDLRRVLNKFLS